jgi:hypothetical protein
MKVSGLPVDYEPSCVSINSEHLDVAVGGVMDNKVIAVTFAPTLR